MQPDVLLTTVSNVTIHLGQYLLLTVHLAGYSTVRYLIQPKNGEEVVLLSAWSEDCRA